MGRRSGSPSSLWAASKPTSRWRVWVRSCFRQVSAGVGPRASLHVVEGADHSFAVLKRSGRTGAEVLEELADTIAAWARSV